MPVYTVFAFWGADSYAAVFNAVAAIMGGNDFAGLLRSVAIVGFVMAAVAALMKIRFNEVGIWFAMLVIFYGALFIPKVTVAVQDQRTGVVHTIDNVPLGLGFFASTTSHIGKWLTETFETNFSSVDDERFSKTGMVFGARLIEQLQAVKLASPSLYRDQTQFFSECVNPEIINRPTLYNEIFNSKDLWAKLGESTFLNPGRITTYTNVVGDGVTANCYMAYHALHNNMLEESTRRISYLGDRIYPGDPTAQIKMIASIEHAETALLGASRTAQESIIQGMAMNMFVDGQKTIASVRNDPAAAQIAAAVSMAEQSAAVSYGAMAKIAENTLPRLRVALELIIIALFPVILVLVIAAGEKGGLVLKTYLMSMAWVQLWAPLYAVLNFLAWSADRTGLMAMAGGAGGASLGTFYKVSHQALSSQSITSMLTVAVPVMAYAIVKGGEVAGTSIASSVMAPAQGAAQKSGDAIGQGNVSGGNIQWGNVAMGGVSAGGWNVGTSSVNTHAANKDQRDTSVTDPNVRSFNNGLVTTTAIRGGGNWKGSDIGPGFEGDGWSAPVHKMTHTGGAAMTPSVGWNQGRANTSFSQDQVQAATSLKNAASNAIRDARTSSTITGFESAYRDEVARSRGTRDTSSDSTNITGGDGWNSRLQTADTWNAGTAARAGVNMEAGARGQVGVGGGGNRGKDKDGGGGMLGGLKGALGVLAGGIGVQGNAERNAAIRTGGGNEHSAGSRMEAMNTVQDVKENMSSLARNHSDANVRTFASRMDKSLSRVLEAAKGYEAAVSASSTAGSGAQDTRGIQGGVNRNLEPEAVQAVATQMGLSGHAAATLIATRSSPQANAIYASVVGQTLAGERGSSDYALSNLNAPKNADAVATQGVAAATGAEPTSQGVTANITNIAKAASPTAGQPGGPFVSPAATPGASEAGSGSSSPGGAASSAASEAAPQAPARPKYANRPVKRGGMGGRGPASSSSPASPAQPGGLGAAPSGDRASALGDPEKAFADRARQTADKRQNMNKDFDINFDARRDAAATQAEQINKRTVPGSVAVQPDSAHDLVQRGLDRQTGKDKK